MSRLTSTAASRLDTVPGQCAERPPDHLVHRPRRLQVTHRSGSGHLLRQSGKQAYTALPKAHADKHRPQDCKGVACTKRGCGDVTAVCVNNTCQVEIQPL